MRISVRHSVFKSHNDAPYANLTSMHSWVGLAAVSLFAQNFILGALHFLFRAFDAARSYSYSPYHHLLGYLGFMLALAAVQSGITENGVFINCGYEVNKPDYNPIANYHLLPAGCRLGNGIGVLALVLALLVTTALHNFAPPGRPLQAGMQPKYSALASVGSAAAYGQLDTSESFANDTK